MENNKIFKTPFFNSLLLINLVSNFLFKGKEFNTAAPVTIFVKDAGIINFEALILKIYDLMFIYPLLDHSKNKDKCNYPI